MTIGLTTNYFSFGSGAPSTAPSVASGEYALYQNTANGDLYEWNLSGTPGWTKIFDHAAGGGGSALPFTCQGRLTLTTAVPVTTSDVTAATTVYFTPYRGNQVGTYSGAVWTVQAFTEKSLSLSGLTASKNYDIFMVDSTLALEALIWTNDTTRATALVLQDGVYVKSGATTRRYLGTIRTTGTTGQCEDSVANRFVFNYANPLERPLKVVDSTDTWTYAVTSTWRAANASTANRVSYVCGISETMTHARVYALGFGGAGSVGVGVDSTTANSAETLSEVQATQESSLATYRGFPGVGFHFLQWIEYCRVATQTWNGDGGDPANIQSGLTAEIWA